MIYDTINPEIVKFILHDAFSGARILDVGCGTGKIGYFLKSKINCYLVGIEIDPEAARLAKDGYDELIVMDLEDLIDKGVAALSQPKKYNFIILGDVLEHVSRPEVILKYFAGCLEEDGFLIASIPNIANWMVRISLFFGNFSYSGGILDPGHLRFFTYKTAKKLLQDNGYRIMRVANNNHTPLIRLLGRVWKSMFAFQFVFKCRKKRE